MNAYTIINKYKAVFKLFFTRFFKKQPVSKQSLRLHFILACQKLQARYLIIIKQANNLSFQNNHFGIVSFG